MAGQKIRDRKLTPEEAAKYRAERKEIELEKPQIIAKAQEIRPRGANNWQLSCNG